MGAPMQQPDRDEVTAPASAGLISCPKHGADHMAITYSGSVMGWFCRACDRDSAARQMRNVAAKAVEDQGADLQGDRSGIGVCCGHALVAASRAIGALPLPGEEQP